MERSQTGCLAFLSKYIVIEFDGGLYMKNYEGMGFLIGAVVGAILTGICIYFTSSVASAIISLVCALLGGWIGKSIPKTDK